jgi:hypothetical protein
MFSSAKPQHYVVRQMDLLSTNVKSSCLRNASLLVSGACLAFENKEVFDDMAQGRVPLEVCLEKTHMNMVGFKIATMIKVSSPAEVVVLTMKGSPHCVQLHFAVEQAVKLTGSKLRVRHFVVERSAVREVDRDAVRLARHLGNLDMHVQSSKKAAMSKSDGVRKA